MGTNYYRIPTEEEIIRRGDTIIHSLSTNGITNRMIMGHDEYPWITLMDGINVHLGKASMGWKFCWNFHDGKYYNTKEELFQFIRSGRVIDEYGHNVDTEEFINMALNWYEPNGLVYDEEYATLHEPYLPFTPKYDRVIDGLIVCSSTEFS